MALPHWQYKNPQDVLEWKQEYEKRKSCVGCMHGFKMIFNSGEAMGCDKNRRWGKRCEYYQEVK